MSSPQNSFVVKALKKFDLPRRTLFSENCATSTSRVASGAIRSSRLSIESWTAESLERSEMEILAESGTTRGLTLRLCGATGATISTRESGEQIGPPADNEYAVEPELVATRRPSAQ